MSRPPQVVLASASPRRAGLLAQMGITFRTEAADIDETERPGEAADVLARRLAIDKAVLVARRFDTRRSGSLPPILAADTVVTLDGRILGKPTDRAAGLGMLRALSGRTHRVITAVALARAGTDVADCRESVSQVTFREISDVEAAAYWATGEPHDKAGGYGIQGVGGIFVSQIEGSYSGIVGLPVALTEDMLRAFGVDTWRYRGA